MTWANIREGAFRSGMCKYLSVLRNDRTYLGKQVPRNESNGLMDGSELTDSW